MIKVIESMKRENKIRNYIEEESYKFYEKLTSVPDGFINFFCNQVILTTINDSYDLYEFVRGAGNLYFHSIKDLNSAIGLKIYKWNSYRCLIMLRPICIKNFDNVVKIFGYVFSWNRDDTERFLKLLLLSKNSKEDFIQVFVKEMLKDIFEAKANISEFAFVYNILYCSGMEFEECVQNYATSCILRINRRSRQLDHLLMTKAV